MKKFRIAFSISIVVVLIAVLVALSDPSAGTNRQRSREGPGEQQPVDPSGRAGVTQAPIDLAAALEQADSRRSVTTNVTGGALGTDLVVVFQHEGRPLGSGPALLEYWLESHFLRKPSRLAVELVDGSCTLRDIEHGQEFSIARLRFAGRIYIGSTLVQSVSQSSPTVELQTLDSAAFFVVDPSGAQVSSDVCVAHVPHESAVTPLGVGHPIKARSTTGTIVALDDSGGYFWRLPSLLNAGAPMHVVAHGRAATPISASLGTRPGLFALECRAGATMTVRAHPGAISSTQQIEGLVQAEESGASVRIRLQSDSAEEILLGVAPGRYRVASWRIERDSDGKSTTTGRFETRVTVHENGGDVDVQLGPYEPYAGSAINVALSYAAGEVVHPTFEKVLSDGRSRPVRSRLMAVEGGEHSREFLDLSIAKGLARTGPHTYAASFSRVLPGFYRLEVVSLGVVREFQVGLEDVDIDIELGSLSSLEVHLFDSITRLPVEGRVACRMLLGQPATEPDVAGLQLVQTVDGTARVETHSGLAQLMVHSETHAFHCEQVHVHPGVTTLAVDLPSRPVVDLRIECASIELSQTPGPVSVRAWSRTGRFTGLPAVFETISVERRGSALTMRLSFARSDTVDILVEHEQLGVVAEFDAVDLGSRSPIALAYP